jgi:hypothetical protein
MPVSSSADKTRDLSRPAPVPGFLLRFVPEDALPLYWQMTGYGYRSLGGTRKLLRFHWKRALTFPLILPPVYFLVNARTDSEYLFWTFATLLMIFLPTGMLVMPSPFPSWLVNTARRGFLRDLSLSRLTGDEIVRCHYLARMQALAWLWFALCELFLAMAISNGLGGGPSVTEYLLYHCLALWGMSASILHESRVYKVTLEKGPRHLPWMLQSLYTTTPLAIILFINAMLISYWVFQIFIYLSIYLNAPYFRKLFLERLELQIILAAPLTGLASLALGRRMVLAALPRVRRNWDGLVAQAMAHERHSDLAEEAVAKKTS